MTVPRLPSPDAPMVEWAKFYLGIGFSPLPVKPGTKRPSVAWEQYQHRQPTLAEIERWDWSGGVGVVTNGKVVVDCDRGGQGLLKGRDFPPSWTVKTGGDGLHRYFGTNGEETRNAVRILEGENGAGVDIRANGGFTVMPPTKHPDTGRPYTWVLPPSAIPLAPAPAWILEATAKREVQVQPNDSHWGSRDPGVIARARAYLAKVPPAIEGQGGDTHTLSAACKVVRGFALDEEEAVGLLLEWNSGCQPPWTEREIRQKVTNALKYGTEPIGHLRDSERPHLERRVGEASPVASVASPVAWSIQDAADYQTWKVEPIRWAVEPIIPKDTIGFIGGLPKIGKSLVLCDALLHVTHGKPWLGRYGGDWTPRILYLAREDPIGRIQARIDEMQTGYGFPPIPKERFRLLIRERFQLTEKTHREWLTAYCNSEGIDVVVLDVLGRMIRGKDQMEPKDWGEIQDILEELNREHRLTVAMLDHARKPPDAKKGTSLSAMEIKGPVEKYGGADWSMVLGRTKEKGRLEVVTEGKDTDERLHFLLDVAPLARRKGEGWEIRQVDGTWVPGHPKPKLTYVGDVAELVENRKELGKRNRGAVYAALPDGGKMQIGEVIERLGQAGHSLSRSTVGEHLKALVQERRVDSMGEGRNVWYWRTNGEQGEQID